MSFNPHIYGYITLHYYSDEKIKTCNVIKLAQSHFVSQTDPGSKPSRIELSIQALKLLTRKIFCIPDLDAPDNGSQ